RPLRAVGALLAARRPEDALDLRDLGRVLRVDAPGLDEAELVEADEPEREEAVRGERGIPVGGATELAHELPAVRREEEHRLALDLARARGLDDGRDVGLVAGGGGVHDELL